MPKDSIGGIRIHMQEGENTQYVVRRIAGVRMPVGSDRRNVRPLVYETVQGQERRNHPEGQASPASPKHPRGGQEGILDLGIIWHG